MTLASTGIRRLILPTVARRALVRSSIPALESLAAAVPTVSPTPGADKFAALEKELAALVSRAGNVSPLAALGQEESSDDDENNAF